MDELQSTLAQSIQKRIDMAVHNPAQVADCRITMDLNRQICGADVWSVDCVRDLISSHVNDVAGICCYQLRQLCIIIYSLMTDAAHSLVLGTDPHSNRLMQWPPRYWSKVPSQKVTVLCCRQTSSAAPIPYICF